MADVKRLTNHWRVHPPLRILVSCCAAALGVKLPAVEEQNKKQYLTAEEFGRLVPMANRMMSNPNG